VGVAVDVVAFDRPPRWDGDGDAGGSISPTSTSSPDESLSSGSGLAAAWAAAIFAFSCKSKRRKHIQYCYNNIYTYISTYIYATNEDCLAENRKNIYCLVVNFTVL
jgi:hypothetical protein